tara:strand:+ start:478 stop:735 length:258 start_codon:yes stop_codon:yes gene_type:complete
MGLCKVLDNCENCGDDLWDISFEEHGAICVRDESEIDDLKYFEGTSFCSNECYESYETDNNAHFETVMSCINSIIDEIDNEVILV